MSISEPLTTDDAATLDAMFARSNSANIIDLLATVILRRAVALREPTSEGLYSVDAGPLEVQARVLRTTQKRLIEILTDPANNTL